MQLKNIKEGKCYSTKTRGFVKVIRAGGTFPVSVKVESKMWGIQYLKPADFIEEVSEDVYNQMGSM